MALKFTNLQALTGELDKLVEYAEGKARDVISKKMGAVRDKVDTVIAKAESKVDVVGGAVDELDEALDAVDQALMGDNGGPPISGGSSDSPGAVKDTPAPNGGGLPKAATIPAPATSVAAPGGAAPKPPFPGPGSR